MASRSGCSDGVDREYKAIKNPSPHPLAKPLTVPPFLTGRGVRGVGPDKERLIEGRRILWDVRDDLLHCVVGHAYSSIRPSTGASPKKVRSERQEGHPLSPLASCLLPFVFYAFCGKFAFCIFSDRLYALILYCNARTLIPSIAAAALRFAGPWASVFSMRARSASASDDPS